MSGSIDIESVSMARVYDYLLGGDASFQADRDMAKKVCAALPGGVDGARTNVRASRAFLRQSVRWLVSEAGVRQFLDVGTGIPRDDNVHIVAQQIAADARVVYVDYDPVVLAHAHELRHSTDEGATAFVHGDPSQPGKILRQAAETLDFTRPIALVLVTVLHYLSHEADPHVLVARLLGGLPSGSYLVMTYLASDVAPDRMAEFARRHDENEVTPVGAVCSHAEMSRFFDGLDLVDPGIERLDRWPRHDDWWSQLDDGHTVPTYGGIGRKP